MINIGFIKEHISTIILMGISFGAMLVFILM